MAEEERPRAVLGVDVGSARTIGVLLAADGRVLARARVDHAPLAPRPDRLEQDPETLWSAFREIVQRLKALVEVRLVGLALTGEPGGLVFLDRAGAPVRPAILGPDRRAEAEAQELAARLPPARLHAIAGRRLGPCLSAAKILWLAANEPEAAQRVTKILSPKGYVLFRLTGETVTDASAASATGLLDLARRQWSETVLEALALDPELLPEVFEGGEVCGRVSVAGAAETGLPVGLPVVAGGSELACAALAAGITRQGQGLLWLEPGGGFLLPCGRPLVDPEERLESACGAAGGWLLLGALPQGPSALRWLAETLCPEWAEAARAAGLEPVDAVLGEAGAAERADAPLFFPGLAEEGILGRPAFAELAFHHGRAALARGVLEGIGFALLDRLERARALGCAPESLAASGRVAGSEAWSRLLAAQLGIPLRLLAGGLEPERGAAVLAGIGVGLFRDGVRAAEGIAEAELASIGVEAGLAALERTRYGRWQRLHRVFAAFATS
ncbi:MAG: FGGY family carbohydrate kinase [Geminicoccaceae bacterium]|nr:FGGY family carbohydrate kinase [Geminicoccaceae bacterium]